MRRHKTRIFSIFAEFAGRSLLTFQFLDLFLGTSMFEVLRALRIQVASVLELATTDGWPVGSESELWREKKSGLCTKIWSAISSDYRF